MYKPSQNRTPKKDLRRLYKDLSWTWPIISPPEDYITEGKRIHKIIKKHSKIPVKTMLNLGCGGGHVDWALKKHYEITGVDISPHMLRLARNLNPEIRYLRGDVRKIRLRKKFDTIVLHDAVSYMLTQNDLKKVFKTAYTHLRPGGILYTFAEVHGRLKQNKVHFSTKKKNNIEITFIEHYYDPNIHDTTFEDTFIFLIRKNKKLEVYTDYHISGIFPLSTWLKTLRTCGFRVRKIKCDQPGAPPQTQEFICCKPL